jgi:hypothetical protein
MRTRRTRVAAIAAAMTMSLAGASSAQAQTTQNGLVNVALEDVVAQVPISVAANICDVNVAVLAEVADAAAACEATADSAATTGPSSGGPINQEGLVNVAVSDVVIQVPVSVAANVCDINVAVLAQLDDEAEACNADAESLASRGPGGGGGGGGGGGAGGGLFIPIDLDIGGFTLLDDNTADDGGQGDIITGAVGGLL